MNILLAIMVFVLIALVASLALKDVNTNGTDSGDSGVVVDDSTTDDTTDDDTAEPSDDTDTSDSDDTSTASTSGNIVVYEPDANEPVGLPMVITGKARVFENQFAYRLTDGNGTELVEGIATADAPDIGQFGEFTITANYAEPTTATGTLEVFQYSAMDGSEVDKVTIPVTFADVETMTVNAYFTTAATSADCQTVSAVTRRIPKTQAVARAAIEELLKGPSTNEYEEGFGTNIPSGTTLRSVSIENGVATVEFSEELDAVVSGSCNVGVIRSQIEATLKQFTSVTSVVVLVEGKPVEEVLQP